MDENFGINVQFEESEEEDLDDMQGEIREEADEEEEEGEERMEMDNAIHANVGYFNWVIQLNTTILNLSPTQSEMILFDMGN